MADPRVESSKEIYLNGTLFPITGAVRSQIANQLAPKTVIGEFTEASDPLLSNVTWKGFRGGLGKHAVSVNEEGAFERFWTGNVQNEFDNHTFPQFFSRLLPVYQLGGDTNGPFRFFTRYSDNNDSRGFTFVTNSSGAVRKIPHATPPGLVSSSFFSGPQNPLVSLTSPATDFKSGQVGGLRILAAPQGARMQWTRSDTGDSTWFSDSSENIKHVAFYRGLMFGVNESAELFFTNDLSSTSLSWTNLTQAQVTSSVTVRGLFLGPSVNGNEEDLYLLRNDGFDIYDNATENFRQVFRIPPHPHGGTDVTVFNGSVLYPAGMTIHRWSPLEQGALVTQFGPDRDEGIASSYGGAITSLTSTPKQVFAQVNDTGDSTRFANVLTRQEGTGWTRLATSSAASSESVGKMFVGTNDDSTNFFLFNGFQKELVNDSAISDSGSWGVLLNTITVDGRNPVITTDTANVESFDSASLITPWVTVDGNQTWVAQKITVETNLVNPVGAAAASSFHVDYGLDFAESSFRNVITAGPSDSNRTRYETLLPSDNNPVGIPFSAMRLRFQWEGSSFQTHDLHKATITMIKKPVARRSFEFDVELKDYKGHSPAELSQRLDDFFTQTTNAQFVYKDAGDRIFYVAPLTPQKAEATGYSDRGTVRVALLEVN